MKKTITNSWLQIAFCALIFASCQKAVDTTPANGANGQTQSNTLSNARVAAEDCLATADTVNGTGNGHTYTSWTPTTKCWAQGQRCSLKDNTLLSFVLPTANWYSRYRRQRLCMCRLGRR